MTYYFEVPDFAGRWRPRTSPTRPSEAYSEGGRRVIRGLCEVPPEMENFTLDQLQVWLGPREEGDQTDDQG